MYLSNTMDYSNVTIVVGCWKHNMNTVDGKFFVMRVSFNSKRTPELNGCKKWLIIDTNLVMVMLFYQTFK